MVRLSLSVVSSGFFGFHIFELHQTFCLSTIQNPVCFAAVSNKQIEHNNNNNNNNWIFFYKTETMLKFSVFKCYLHQTDVFMHSLYLTNRLRIMDYINIKCIEKLN